MTTSTEAGAQAPAPAPGAAALPALPMGRSYWSPVPQVNLLPPEVLAERRFRRLKRQLAALTLGVLVASGAAVVWAQGDVNQAHADLATTRGQSLLLERQKATYASVPRTLAELDRMRAARESAMAGDVLWYRFLTDLAVYTPADTELSSILIAMNAGTTPSAPAGDPLSPAGLGTVKITGTARKFVHVAAWLDEVNQVHGLAGSGLESAARQEPGGGAATDGASSGPAAGDTPAGTGQDAGVVKFVGSAVVVPSALSHRYDRKAG